MFLKGEIVMNASQKIYKLRTQRGMTQAELAKIAGVSDKAVSAWESGTRDPKLKAIQNICTYFNLDLNSFVDESTDDFVSTFSNSSMPIPRGFSPMPEMYKVPIYGSIACGEPILAEEHIDGYVGVPKNIRADFALLCKGDSMVNAGIRDGDVVYIRKQETVENGQIAAVIIDGMEAEATLKRFYFEDGVVTLSPENNKYPPKTFVGSDIEKVRIVGLAVGYTHSFEWEG